MKENLHNGQVLPFVRLIPEKLRKPIYGALAGAVLPAVAALGAKCGEQEAEPEQFSPEALTQNINPADFDPLRPFKYPVPIDERIKVQQGWDYSFESKTEHKGIDYVFGEIDDSSTWKSFPVMSVYEGQACANPKNRIGNAVLVRHSINGEDYWTYYGHLSEIKESIPECEQGEEWNIVTKKVGAGEGLGRAGSSGADDPDWVHLHFSVIGPSGASEDPYDILDARSKYPDLLLENGNICGEKTLWANCPIGADVRIGAATYIVPAKTPMPVETDISNEPDPVLDRGAYIERRRQEAELKAQEFMSFMLSGAEEDLEKVYQMQTPDGLKNQFQLEENPNYYDPMTLNKVEACSREMREGQLSGVENRVIRKPIEGNIPNEEQPDLYAVSVAFDFKKWNFSTDRRDLTSQRYNHEGFRHSLYFEDIGGTLYLFRVDICEGNKGTVIVYAR